MHKPKKRQAILTVATELLGRSRGVSFTLDELAAAVPCAKGLIHYHFRGKDRLLVEVIRAAAESRRVRWTEALSRADPEQAIRSTWELVVGEVGTGVELALANLLGSADRQVDEALTSATQGFADALRLGTLGMLERTGLRPTIPMDQISWLLASVIRGTIWHLHAGAPDSTVQESYAVGWLGVLSLTEPIR